MSISRPSVLRAKKKTNKQESSNGNRENAISSSNASLKTKGGHDVTRQGSKPSRVKRTVSDASSNSSIDIKKKANKRVSDRGDVDNADVSSSDLNLRTNGDHGAVRRLRNKALRSKSAARDVTSYNSRDKTKKVTRRINGRGNVDDDAAVSISSVDLKTKNGVDFARQRNKPSRVKSAVQDVSMDKKKAVNKQVNGKENTGNNVKMKTKRGPVVITQRDKPILGKRSLREASSGSSSNTKKAVSSVPKAGFNKKQSFLVKKDADIENEDMPKKKKKRGIRLDPHDVSNKRLDDRPMLNEPGCGEVKEDVGDKSNVEISKNAQFRAIRPSASILSFVEDNLLGRRREIDFRRAGYNIELNAPLDNIPFSTSSERERIEVPVFRNKLEFFAAAKLSSSFPPPDLSEIAFAGRSNVGKSSLLNALTRQWGVARTSDKPGLTQTINFFKLGPKLSLVDLPGYGFAYAKEEVKEAWEELVKEYVATRAGLRRVCLLVDTKWGMKPRDLELIDLMERSQTKYQIVLTKTDLIPPIDVARRASQIEENLRAKRSIVQPSMMVSSKTGAGIRSLRTVLAGIARLARH